MSTSCGQQALLAPGSRWGRPQNGASTRGEGYRGRFLSDITEPSPCALGSPVSSS